MNDAPTSIRTDEQPWCEQQIVAIFLRSAKRKLVSRELRANQLRTNAIRKAAHLAASTDVGLGTGHYRRLLPTPTPLRPAHEYAGNIAKVIEEITQ